MRIKVITYILIFIILIQSITLVLLLSNVFGEILYVDINIYKSFIIYGVIILLDFIGILSVYNIVRFMNKKKETVMRLNHSKEVITALQGQKHDFNNHLNVIAGMLQLDKKNEALGYIFNVSEKVEEVFAISKIKNVEVAATLFRKCAIAENKGIYVDIDINSNLEYLKVTSMEMCKIVFNLIDNAIYELDNCDKENKYLMIDINESDDEDKYVISIGNSFPALPQELYDKVFEDGFTTKGEGGDHGHGLNIVKRIVEKNKGKITVESFEGIGTVFTVYLPMKKRPKYMLNIE